NMVIFSPAFIIVVNAVICERQQLIFLHFLS
ncbi:MAG: hypothetical protein ACI97N_002635, partial [Cognaticolwellia sp.]